MLLWIINVITIATASFFGEKGLVAAGGATLLFTTLFMYFTEATSILGLVAWVVSLFIGNFIVSIRESATAAKKSSRPKRRKFRVQWEGWLTVYLVGLTLGIALNILILMLLTIALGAPGETESTSLVWFRYLAVVGQTGLGIYTLVLFIQCKRLAKTMAIAYILTGIITAIIIDIWTNSANGNSAAIIGIEKETIRSGIYSCLWALYILRSKRVEKTLVR